MRSMTGYGRARGVNGGLDVTVELKSVNHRYFELYTRVPRTYMQLEDLARGYLQRRVVRGKMELNISIDDTSTKLRSVKVDKPLLHAYFDALKDVGEEFGVPFEPSALLALRLPEVVNTAQDESDMDIVWKSVLPVLEQATDAFIAQRESEGQRLCADITQKCGQILSIVDEINLRAPQLVDEYTAKLRTRIAGLLGDTQVDEQRLLSEVAIMADRLAIDEEIVRLRSHSQSLREMFDSDVSNGKKLDFIIQEMNRETNTISSKIGDIQVTRQVIEIKNLIEKIREQVQNIE